MNTKSLTVTAMFAALMCVLGPLSIPIGPIPFSLSVFTVYLSAYVLGSKRGTLAVLVYLLIGLLGLPVFSGFSGGPGKLFGPTGGYLIGFLPMAVLTGRIRELSDDVKIQSLGMLAALLACYLPGTAWLAYFAKMSFSEAAVVGMWPFIGWDVIKLILSVMAGQVLLKRVPYLSETRSY